MKIVRTMEFKHWFYQQTEKAKAQIDARLKNIQIYGHFGDRKDLGRGLWELRWKSGRRLYYHMRWNEELIIVLLGGFKNAQEKDIQKARKILAKENSE